MAKITEMTQPRKGSIHPKWDDEDYTERLKVDNHDSYTKLTKGFDEMCRGMNIEELEKKLTEIEKAHTHVSNSLEAQKMRGAVKPTEVIKKTLYTKGLLEDQLKIGKSYKEKLLRTNNLIPIEEDE